MLWLAVLYFVVAAAILWRQGNRRKAWVTILVLALFVGFLLLLFNVDIIQEHVSRLRRGR